MEATIKTGTGGRRYQMMRELLFYARILNFILKGISLEEFKIEGLQAREQHSQADVLGKLLKLSRGNGCRERSNSKLFCLGEKVWFKPRWGREARLKCDIRFLGAGN